MKILVIRGKNLASLAAEFAIDFQSEPLASAGLYAICGPTGSGKSTLLDALCLALYERTPRLSRVGRGGDIPDVGDNDITPSDPRTLLRRGAAEGFAEVDFVGRDAVAYRARWSVRRSRSKIDGKLQQSEVSLLRLVDAQPLGDHRKSETLKRIEACVGLNFEQFTRAVLLAQNDFAAFLKASDDERAELLQTLTGTGTFATISMQAYARMKAEKEALERLQAQLKDQQPLSPDARADKQNQLQQHAAQASELAQQRTVLEAHLRWFQQWDRLQAAQGEARQKLEAAQAEQVAAAPRYAQLTRLEQVQAARPLCAELTRLTQALAATEAAELAARADLNATQDQVSTCQATQTQALAQEKLAETARLQAQPAIDQARALDVRITTLTPQWQAAVLAQNEAQKHLLTQEKNAQEAIENIASNESDLAQAQDWLAAHTTLRPLAEGWQRWEALFAQAQQGLSAQTQTGLADLNEKAAAQAQASVAAQAALARATEATHAASATLDTLAQACAAVDAEQLAQDKQALEARREQLHSAAQLWQRHTELSRQQDKLHAQQQAHQQELRGSQQALDEGSPKRALLEAELHSAEQALHLAQLAASKNAETLRARLQDGQACPVCGAVEHPYANHAPVADAMLKSLQDHVKVKQADLRALLDLLAAAQARQASSRAHLEQLGQEQGQLEADRSDCLTQWSAHSLQAEVNVLTEPERSPWLMAQQEGVRTALAHLSQQEAAYREQLKQREAAQQVLNRAQLALTEARASVSRLEVEHGATAQAIEATQHQLSELDGQITALLDQLDGAFGHAQWQSRWREDAAVQSRIGPDASGLGVDAATSFVAQCRSDAQAWLSQQERRTTLTHRLSVLQQERTACQSACEQARQQFHSQQERCTLVATELQVYRDQRNALWAGQALAEVESGLNAALQAARGAVSRSTEGLQTAQDELARRQEALRQNDLQLDQLRRAGEAAQSQLAAWLIDFNAQHPSPEGEPALSVAELHSLHEISPQRLSDERKALQQLEQSLSAAQAVLLSQQQTLTVHEAAKPGPEDVDALQVSLSQTTQAMDALAETLSALKIEIAQDDERLAKSESLRAEIERQTATARVWAQLSELIGSADGKKFRNFAQQLTLDILLDYGNRHLQSLTRRYRLQRIKDSLGLLVVDQDMGDEVRSVHSLSGGESFLVSLALALGLASLSSHRVQVESLFIDEGFGSLDAESLRVAMDALDNLQAQGRKVGVISHVAEMTERIGTRVQVLRQAGGVSRVVVG
nr:AAA family ATPase [uncultured Rhodoferax sp.]